MQEFVTSVTATLFFIALGLVGTWRTRSLLWLVAIGPCCALVGTMVGWMLLSLQAVATFLLGIAAMLGGGRSRRAAAWVLCSATAASYGFMGLLANFRIFELIAERDELQAMYPMISLDERLAYEDEPVAGKETSRAGGTAPLSEPVEQALRTREGRGRLGIRDLQLQRLHDETSDRFIAAEGFGPMRFFGMREIRLPPLPTLSLDHAGISATESAFIAHAKQATYVPARFMRMHERSERDFLERNRMGYIENRKRVTGFEPHAFTKIPVPPASDRSSGDPEDCDPNWSAVRVELLSLLKHDPPAAYVSEYLPRMDELRDAPTRPLIPFEQTALESLRTNHDVVAEQRNNVIRMVGSLRAGNDCVICHRGSRGELLGAISYELRRTW
jgi:hypothetical protein